MLRFQDVGARVDDLAVSPFMRAPSDQDIQKGILWSWTLLSKGE